LHGESSGSPYSRLLRPAFCESAKANTHLCFNYGGSYSAYANHVYSLLADYCNSAPKVSKLPPHKVTGKSYERITFQTLYLFSTSIV